MFQDRYNAWEIGTRTEVCENKLLKTSISSALSCDFMFFLNVFVAVIITYILRFMFVLSFLRQWNSLRSIRFDFIKPLILALQFI